MNNEVATRPQTSPEGWSFLQTAFYQLGQAAFGNWWMARANPKLLDAAISGHALPPMLQYPRDDCPTDIRPHIEDAASFYAVALCQYINREARLGRLRTGYKPKGAGLLEPMPAGAWETDNHWLRFVGWGLDPAALGASGYDLPCWVFVDASDVVARAGELRDWRDRLPMFVGQEWDHNVIIPPAYMLGSPVGISGDETLFISCPRLPSTPLALRTVEGGATVTPIGKAKNTKPKPDWYPVLRDLVDQQDRRLAEFALNHPGSTLPIFPKAPWFRKKLATKGFDEATLRETTVRYHVAALKREFGR